MAKPLDILIVERLGTIKMLSVKDFKLEELYKKCGFKKQEDFIKQTEWNVKHDDKKYTIQVYAKTEGRANSENKYEFPPPIDKVLFYGSCAIIAFENEHNVNVNLSVAIWNKVYQTLMGGFHDLSKCAKEDEDEEDELKHVAREKKTKEGYLKDHFVVDNDNSTEECSPSTHESSLSETNEEEEEDEDDDEIELESLRSELSEESYDYEDALVGDNE